MNNSRAKRVMRQQAREAYVADLRDGRKLRPATFKDRRKDAAHRRHWKNNKKGMA
jgi:hypothetical protein